MSVMKYPEDGHEMKNNGSVNEEYQITIIQGIHSDGAIGNLIQQII